MELIGQLVSWLTDPAQWSGKDSIPVHLAGHLALSAAALAAGAAIALPLGLAIGHTGRGAFVVVALANIGRAVPSVAILGLAFPLTLTLGLGLGFAPTVIALTALAIPPIVTNTYAALRGVDRDLVEAGRGMGMGEGQLLGRVELPIALPLIVGGVRTSAVQVVATATLGAVLSADCLGFFILKGFAIRNMAEVVAGALMVTVLALLTEGALALAQRRSAPAGGI
jgi:osmoprotectant transport system permease protein